MSSELREEEEEEEEKKEKEEEERDRIEVNIKKRSTYIQYDFLPKHFLSS